MNFNNDFNFENRFKNSYYKHINLEEAFNNFSKNQSEENFRLLVNICGQEGNINVATKLFDLIKQNQLSNNIRVNSINYDQLIQAFTKKNMIKNGLEIYEFMIERKLKPTRYTFNYLLNGNENGDLEFIKKIEDEMKKYNIEINIYLASTLIDSYSKCGDLDSAISIFNKIQEKNVFIYGAMIKGCITNKKYEEALFYFDDMKKNGIIPDDVIYILILKACCRNKKFRIRKTNYI